MRTRELQTLWHGHHQQVHAAKLCKEVHTSGTAHGFSASRSPAAACMRRTQQSQITSSPTRAAPTIPPITPPTMAAVLLDRDCGIGTGAEVGAGVRAGGGGAPGGGAEGLLALGTGAPPGFSCGFDRLPVGEVAPAPLRLDPTLDRNHYCPAIMFDRRNI